MGSDLVVTHIAYDNHSDEPIEFVKAKEFVLELLRTHLSDWDKKIPDYDSIAENVGLPSSDEGMDDTVDRHAACGKLIRCIEEVEKAWNGELRDARVVSIGNYDILISGGMSFGDFPTESARWIDMFAGLGLHVKAGFAG